MRWTVPVLLLSVVLAGCLGGLAEEDGANTSETSESNTSLANETEQLAYESQAPESAKQGGAHKHDPWGDATRKTLFDGTAEAGDCYGAFVTVFLLAFNAAFNQEAAYGCAVVPLENGTLVPQGTEKVAVHADATDALKQGGYEASVFTNADNYLEGETSREPEHTWWFELNDEDWDVPHQSRSGFQFNFFARGEVAVLRGDIQVEIVAHKIPNWTPPLADAHLDHWQLEDRHEFVQPGVIRSLDTNATVRACNWAEQVQGCSTFDDRINLTDIIPPGTGQTALVLTWDEVTDCPPALYECRPSAFMRAGSSWAFTSPTDEGSGYTIYVFDASQVSPDSTYANESEWTVVPDMDDCIESPDDPIGSIAICGDPVWGAEAEVHFAVEAWRDGVDLGALKSRYGLGGS